MVEKLSSSPKATQSFHDWDVYSLLLPKSADMQSVGVDPNQAFFVSLRHITP